MSWPTPNAGLAGRLLATALARVGAGAGWPCGAVGPCTGGASILGFALGGVRWCVVFGERRVCICPLLMHACVQQHAQGLWGCGCVRAGRGQGGGPPPLPRSLPLSTFPSLPLSPSLSLSLPLSPSLHRASKKQGGSTNNRGNQVRAGDGISEALQPHWTRAPRHLLPPSTTALLTSPVLPPPLPFS